MISFLLVQPSHFRTHTHTHMSLETKLYVIQWLRIAFSQRLIAQRNGRAGFLITIRLWCHRAKTTPKEAALLRRTQVGSPQRNSEDSQLSSRVFHRKIIKRIATSPVYKVTVFHVTVLNTSQAQLESTRIEVLKLLKWKRLLRISWKWKSLSYDKGRRSEMMRHLCEAAIASI